MTLPSTPDAFRLWLATLPDVEVFPDGTIILERFLGARGVTASVAYTLYAVGEHQPVTVHEMPDWATDVVHVIDTGACRTAGELLADWDPGEAGDPLRAYDRSQMLEFVVKRRGVERPAWAENWVKGEKTGA